jgi:hypothetical protein
MALLEPIVIVFATGKSISSVNLRVPISCLFALDEASLEGLVTVDPQSSETCLQRYFVILFDSISDEFFENLQANDHVQAIYSRNAFSNAFGQLKLHRIMNKQWDLFTLDLTSDIVNFLTIEGEKQSKLKQIPLAQVYYRQARLLKDWAMSFVKVRNRLSAYIYSFIHFF